MWWLLEELESIRRFLGMGGDVLMALFVLSFMLWTVLLERWFYFAAVLPRAIKKAEAAWIARPEHKSWNAKMVRQEIVSRQDIENKRGLPIIKVLIALCPLLGLLGIVVGMIQVFDILAVIGTGSPAQWRRGSRRQQSQPLPVWSHHCPGCSSALVLTILQKSPRRSWKTG